MRQKLPNIRSNDGRFHNGNPETGALGTIVDDVWLNNVQDTLQDFFEEFKNVLALVEVQANPNKKTQIAEAISTLIGSVQRIANNAHNLAASKQSPATTLAGYGITNAMRVDVDNKNINLATLLGQNTVWGTAGRERSVIGLLSNIYNYGVGLSISASGGQALIYVPHSSANDNKGVWVMSAYAGNSAAPAWRRIDGTDWEDIRNPVNASTTRRGLAQYTDNVNFDSSDWGASAKALRTVNIKAENANNNANGRVSKSGDTMNSLGINSGHRITAHQYGYGSYAQQKDNEAPFFVREHNANGSNAYFPALKTRVRNGDGWTTSFSFGYTTPNGRNQWGEGAILLNEDNGYHRYWRFKHNGDFHSAADVVADNGYRLKNTHQVGNAYVDTTIRDASYGGVNIRRRGTEGNWDSRIEPLVDKRWKFWVQNSHEIFLPAKGGTVLLDNDITYQKIGGFEVRKYPDGTMVQTYRFTPPNQRVGAQDRKFTFNWAAAFVDIPKIFIQHLNLESSGYGSLDMTMNIVKNETTNAKVTFWVWEWYHNNNLIEFDFMAIGRWK